MRKQFITSTFILICLTTVLATTVNAQSKQRLEVTVPFQFVLNSRTLPAGKYVVERIDPAKPNMLVLKNTDEGTVFLILAQRVEKENPSETSNLVFLRRDNKLYLFQIWPSGVASGNQVGLIGHDERRDQHIKNSSLVRLTVRKR
jgi:hypothetical protein